MIYSGLASRTLSAVGYSSVNAVMYGSAFIALVLFEKMKVTRTRNYIKISVMTFTIGGSQADLIWGIALLKQGRGRHCLKKLSPRCPTNDAT